MKRVNLVLLIIGLTGSALAESIEGTWQGKLIVSPGNELTIQFAIEASDGGYAVSLNSPDAGAIKNVPADTVSFEQGELVLEVSELSGSYSGKLSDGTISGNWKQLDQQLPLVLTPLIKAKLSDALRSRLSGRWEGPLIPPGGDPILIEMIFEIDDDDNVTGDMGLPEQATTKFPIADILVSESEISLNVSSINMSFKGSFEEEGIVGEWSQGMALPLTLVKKAFDPKSLALEISDEAKALVMGSWFGYSETPIGNIPVVYRFEQVDDYIRGYFDSPDQGANDIPIKAVTLEGDEITIQINKVVGFNGKVVGGKLAGEFSQGNQTLPLNLERGRLPPIALTVPKHLLGTWKGEQKSQKGTNTVVIRFEEGAEGVIVGYVDQPDVGLKGSRIHELTVLDDKVTIKLSEVTRTSYTGTLSDDELDGTASYGAKEMEFKLVRSKQ